MITKTGRYSQANTSTVALTLGKGLASSRNNDDDEKQSSTNAVQRIKNLRNKIFIDLDSVNNDDNDAHKDNDN